MGAKQSAVLVLGAATLILCACASPQPTASPTPSPSPTPSLHVGGLARLIDDFTPELGPGDRPDPEHGPVAVKRGDIVYLVEGPRLDGTRSLWQVIDPAYWPLALGWVPERDAADTVVMEPFAADCPDRTKTISADTVGAIGPAQALSCFGGDTVVLSADLLCTQVAGDGPYFLAGAPWLGSDAGILCFAGSQPNDFTVFGQPLVDATQANGWHLNGHALLTGHYDDPAAADCEWAPGNYAYVPLDQDYEASAVMSCRLHFVVTAVRILTTP